MWTRLKRFMLGDCTTEPPTEQTRAEQRERMWRPPFQRVLVPGYYGPDSLMLKVLFLFSVWPGWKLFFHYHVGTDPIAPHCHGGRVLAIILWKGYIEERIDGGADQPSRIVDRKPLSINWIPLDSYHAIRELPRGNALTLVLVFPTVQEVHYAYEGQSVGSKSYWRMSRRAA